MPDFLPAAAQAELNFPGNIGSGARDSGAAKTVRRVQEWCTFHRHATEMDGEFGPATVAAVSTFQRASNLAATGVVEQTTWEALVAPMRACLLPNTADVTERLYDVVVRTAKRHHAEKPIELGGDNRGAWVRLYMEGRDGKAWAWCAGFACFIIAQAAASRTGGAIPIPYRVGVDDLVSDAKHAGRFVPEQHQPDARITPGCLFVKRRSATDWYHTGVVTAVAGQSFQTIEGNTDPDGGWNGFQVFSKTRAFPNTDFILLP